MAASEGYIEIVQYLVREAKVKVNPIDRMEGFTPIMDAKKNKHKKVVELLEQSGGVSIDSNLG